MSRTLTSLVYTLRDEAISSATKRPPPGTPLGRRRPGGPGTGARQRPPSSSVRERASAKESLVRRD